jgi:hypothetical protein
LDQTSDREEERECNSDDEFREFIRHLTKVS